MARNSLSKSIFKNLYEFLGQRSDLSSDIINVINLNLDNKIKEYNHVDNKKIRYHLFCLILPAISTFEILLENNIPSETALKYIEEYVYAYYQKTVNFYKRLGKLPMFYSIFKAVFGFFMKLYPAEGWNIEWLKSNHSEVSFNMHSCLYYDTFKKFGCAELTHIFCGIDDLCYGNMSDKMSFVRTKTIGRGNELCDFKFISTKKKRA